MKDVPPTIKAHLEKSYRQATSLSDFIEQVYRENDCIVFTNWLQQVVIKCISLLYTFTWEIELEQLHVTNKNIRIKKLETTPEGMFGGGGDFVSRFSL